MKQLSLQFEDRPAAKRDTQIRFLLGPAGSGKTWQCLDEIRRELIASPDGAPLIFLAPRQATFQLERQLLEGPGLSGYSRLHILSFDRLARFVFHQLRQAEPSLLSEEGRIMVLRAILNETQNDLTIFQTCARRSGFAQELSDQIREFQSHGLSPEKVRDLGAKISGCRVRQKLLDLAFLYERYRCWLDQEKLEDADALLEKAADLLESTQTKAFEIQALWFDGFAQLTPQERRFLISILPYTNGATLAFCLAQNSSPDSEFSSWYLVSQTARKCATAIENRFGKNSITREYLCPVQTRFAASADLAHLEAQWAAPKTRTENNSIHLIECGDPQQEASFCAREIVHYVREGGRYRDVAVLLRNFENDYPHVFRRVFQKYQIPFFLDHRESIAHHPLAELTRGAIRTLAFNWRSQDWFATLKSGLVHSQTPELDELENRALAYGWEGALWETGFRIKANPQLEESSNELRKQLVRPFFQLRVVLGETPSGGTLAEGIQRLWEKLRVQSQIEDWTRDTQDARHETVWTQMQSWLENIGLAFRHQSHSLADWLPILEAGFAGLTVGIIPPVLDQVLIGAVDRSRNPDLKVLFVAGFNENIFPAHGARDALLTESDRDALRETGSELGEIPALHFAQEQFYGYIACTRPREKLVITYAKAGLDGKARNPSRFISHLQRLFPNLKARSWNGVRGARIEHLSEIYSSEDLQLLLQEQKSSDQNPLSRRRDQLLALSAPSQDDTLDPAIAALLYGKELNVSVSSLEQYAMCPFRFFLSKGLGLQERERYELDVREQGSFQHEVLSCFHEEVQKRGKQWRDLSHDEASDLIAEIADSIIPEFKDGLLKVNGKNRFAAHHYKSALQEFIRVIIDWFETNDFNPAHTEMPFGLQSDIPGWRLTLRDSRELVLHGRMDRIDVLIQGKQALAVVIDYKSGSKNPDKTLLRHGIQQQLPAYLLALRSVREISAKLGVDEVIPIGCFFVPLRGKYESEKTRAEVLAQKIDARKIAAQHLGLFNFEYIEHLDKNFAVEKSEQFKYRLTDKNVPHGSSFNALPGDAFDRLLGQTESLLLRFGDEIYSGNIRIFPHKKGGDIACEKCQYQAICRFDPWEQPYNTLAKPGNGKSSSGSS